MGDVKRYDPARYVEMREVPGGPYVKYSGYAALLARHNALVEYETALLGNLGAMRKKYNALVEAVAWERECRTVSFTDLWFDEWNRTEDQSKSAMRELRFTRRAARAEVDRLIARADCKGEG